MTEETRPALPTWAEEWAHGTCKCGASLVRALDMTGAYLLACVEFALPADACNRKPVVVPHGGST